jgi:PAS domain S-box-containing protein
MTDTLIIADRTTPSALRTQEVLNGLGVDSRIVLCAADLVTACREFSPSVVLVSERLPGMDLRRLLGELRQLRSDLEIVAVCSRSRLSAVARRLDPLVSALLCSPLHPDEMRLVLRGVMDRVALRRQLQQSRRDMARKLRRRYVRRIETERFLTVKQILDQVSTFIGGLAREVEGGVRYVNEIPYFIAIHDRKCRVVAANRAYRTLLGRRIGDPSWEVYAGGSRSRERCPVGRTLASENALEVRETLTYRSGFQAPVIVHTAPIYNDDGAVKLVMEVSAGTRDVHRLKEDLRNTQQRYQLLFDAVPCHVAVLDTRMRFTAVNRHFAEVFGDQTGVLFRDAFPIDPEKLRHTPIRRTFQDAKPHHGEMTWVDAAGHRTASLVWTSPILSAAGKLLQVLLIFVDITQIRDLQHNLSFLGLMIASISHSIKGVLSGLDAGVYTLEKAIAARDPDRVQEGLGLVKHMAERIRKITLDILFYAKERELNRTSGALRQLVADVTRTIAPRFDRRGIRLTCDLEGAAGDVEVDFGLLKAVLINLLENAVDACLADGKRKSDYRVTLKAECNAEAVGLSVEDNGVGMHPDQLKKLFTVFYSTKGIRGTGLGLFIADTIVRQHGGDMVVESSPGQGSRFCIRLPARAAGSSQPGSATLPGGE